MSSHVFNASMRQSAMSEMQTNSVASNLFKFKLLSLSLSLS
jgi:hypothetical protein